MSYPNNQDLCFIRLNKLLGINFNSSEINSLSKVVIPNFIMIQLSTFIEKTDYIQKFSVHTDKYTALLDRLSFSLKDVLHSLLLAANAFTKVERKQALEMILISFQKIQKTLLNSKVYDLDSLMSLAIDKIQLAEKKESIQEQDLLIAEILDAIDDMSLPLDDEQSGNENLEKVNMSYENLLVNMSQFAAREISLNES